MPPTPALPTQPNKLTIREDGSVCWPYPIRTSNQPPLRRSSSPLPSAPIHVHSLATIRRSLTVYASFPRAAPAHRSNPTQPPLFRRSLAVPVCWCPGCRGSPIETDLAASVPSIPRLSIWHPAVMTGGMIRSCRWLPARWRAWAHLPEDDLRSRVPALHPAITTARLRVRCR